MKILVVYESMYGNTRTIAEAIAEGLRGAGPVRLGTPDDLSRDEVRDATLLVAGGPTHAHGMARKNAHEELAKNKHYAQLGPLLPGKESLRAWLDALPMGTAMVATFDTRYDKPRWLTGSAAGKIAKRLGKKRYDVIGSESFFVVHGAGPLADGERERALQWGRLLAEELAESRRAA